MLLDERRKRNEVQGWWDDHLCTSATHATGLVLAAEVNRTLVLPRLLVDGSAAEFGYGCNMSPSHIPACCVVLDCHIAAAEMHCMTGGAPRSRSPWSAIAPCCPVPQGCLQCRPICGRAARAGRAAVATLARRCAVIAAEAWRALRCTRLLAAHLCWRAAHQVCAMGGREQGHAYCSSRRPCVTGWSQSWV